VYSSGRRVTKSEEGSCRSGGGDLTQRQGDEDVIANCDKKTRRGLCLRAMILRRANNRGSYRTISCSNTNEWEHLRDVGEEAGRTKRDERSRNVESAREAVQDMGGSERGICSFLTISSHTPNSGVAALTQLIASRPRQSCTSAPTRRGPCKDHLKRACYK
jgi:hypothetical protein